MRLLGDPKQAVSMAMAHRLDDFAEQDPSVHVRQQLACTAARLPAHQAMPVINANINRDIDSARSVFAAALVVGGRTAQRQRARRSDEAIRSSVVVEVEARTRDVAAAARTALRGRGDSSRSRFVSPVAASGANDDERDRLLASLLAGWREAPREPSPTTPALLSPELTEWIVSRWQTKPEDSTLLSFTLGLKYRPAYDRTLKECLNPQADASRRVALLALVADAVEPVSAEPLLAVMLSATEPEAVRSAAASVLARLNSRCGHSHVAVSIPEAVLQAEVSNDRAVPGAACVGSGVAEVRRSGTSQGE